MQMDTELKEAQEGMIGLIGTCRSVILGTASHDNTPLSSYAPVYVDDTNCLFVYVSGLGKHYAHLRKSKRCSAMLIEDESTAEKLFARKRLTLDCSVDLVERGSSDWEAVIQRMEKRLGETMSYLKDMTDFDLFRLVPKSGRLVLGFGKAYDVKGEGLLHVDYVRAGGHKS